MKRRITYMGATPSPGLRNYPIKLLDYLFGASHQAFASPEHLEATMGWLARAQDEGPDDGVARMYNIRSGWGSSYPETTGYIIPTCFVYARHAGKPEYAERAARMASWESDVQMADGAVQGGVIADKPSPAIFNTGQVLFGWRAAFLETGDQRFRESAMRGADYLLQQMDDDGAWRRNLSAFTSTSLDTYAYNVRTAWALLLVDQMLPGRGYAEAARKNVSFVLSLCEDNGWIAKNCLGRPEQPLLHTIAYAYQGLLECAQLTGAEEAMVPVLRGNENLRANFEYFGRLHGRYAKDWNPTVWWRCLTGEAQTSIVWHRLAQLTGDDGWRDAAAELNAQIKRTQILSGPPEKVGGVKGAYPITSPYGALEYLNWAAKFFADALMLEMKVEDASLSG